MARIRRIERVTGESRKRRYRRRTVRVLVEFSSPAGPSRDYATTLGAGGLFLETESALAEGSMLKLRFCVASGGPVHEMEGRVVWSRRSAAPGVGIEFTDRNAIAALARDLETLS